MKIFSPQMSLTSENPLGGGVFDAMLLRHLSELGVEAVVPLIFRRDHESAPGWDVRVLPVRRAYKLGALLTNTIFLAYAVHVWFIRRERFDVFRVQDPYYSGIAAVLFRVLTGVPYYCHVHHVERRGALMWNILRMISRRADRVFVISEFTARQVREELGVPAERIVMVYPGATAFPAPVDSSSIRERLGLGDRPVLAFVGALIARKNIFFLLDCLRLVMERFPDVFLVICGRDPPGGGLSKRLRRRIEGTGLSDNVLMTGFVDNRSKAEILLAADVFVLPSLLEGFGMAPVEAMALGTPVVISDRGALPEVVEDGRTGLLADPTNARDFADKIIRLLEDPDLRGRMGKEASAFVRDKFDWRIAAERTLEMLRELGGRSLS